MVVIFPDKEAMFGSNKPCILHRLTMLFGAPLDQKHTRELLQKNEILMILRLHASKTTQNVKEIAVVEINKMENFWIGRD